MSNIDLHTHVIPPTVVDVMRNDPQRFGTRVIERDGELYFERRGNIVEMNREFYDIEAKIAAMDRMRIDISALSVAPPIYFYALAPDAGLAAARMSNDGIAKMVAKYPARLRGMATLPMQDADAAVAELERAVKEHGFRAVELGCRVRGELLSEPRFRPVLRRAQELGVFIFTHPYIAGSLPADLNCYYLGNLAGLPFDTALMAAHLMFGGALDELPKLNVILAHGGGHLPYQIGRLAHGYEVRKEARAKTPNSPAALLRRFYFDALTHDADALRFLVGKAGADRVMIGTDAPYDMGEENPVTMIESLKGLSRRDRDRILGLNALALLGEA
jgi:aminocarboxymuconate-semialdehyde decarboxylase